MGGGLSSPSKRSTAYHVMGGSPHGPKRSSSLIGQHRRLSAIGRLNWFQSKKTEYLRENGDIAAAEVAPIEKRLRKMVSKSQQFASKSNSCNRLSKDQLRSFFWENGVRFEPIIFERLYQMMEVDEEGHITVDKLALTFSLLIRSGSVAQDNVELAFRLFDSNQDGSIDQSEFQEMIIALIGKRVAHVYEIDAGILYFRQFVESEYASELLDFLDETIKHDGKVFKSPLTLEHAEFLFKTFLETNSDKQVNVSDDVREACRSSIEYCKSSNLATLTSNDPFFKAQKETIKMLEQGPLVRFKTKLRSERTIAPLGDSVWKTMGMKPDDQMTLELFRLWSSSSPDLFNFLDELHKLLHITDDSSENTVVILEDMPEGEGNSNSKSVAAQSENDMNTEAMEAEATVTADSNKVIHNKHSDSGTGE